MLLSLTLLLSLLSSLLLSLPLVVTVIALQGKRPQRSLTAYGSYLRALPHANEQGLRMLIGAAVKAGAARGVALQPLFSLYSYHGPVFRYCQQHSLSCHLLLCHFVTAVGVRISFWYAATSSTGCCCVLWVSSSECPAVTESVSCVCCLLGGSCMARVLLRVERSNDGLPLQHYGFVGHCYHHGENRRVGWRGLSQAWCRYCSSSPAALSHHCIAAMVSHTRVAVS